MFHIKIFSDETEFAESAFEQVGSLLERVSCPVLGLATGSTPLPLYALLSQACQEKKLDFSHVTAFNLDEYIGLPSWHPQSYHSFMEKYLFSHVNIPRENIHIPDGDTLSGDPCQNYEEQLQKTQIDLQILGIGSNGHIGFNEPGTDFGSLTHIVALKESTRHDNARFFHDPSEVPDRAITMGIRSIMQAKSILLMAAGSKKADAIWQMLYGPVTSACPASVLQLHPDVTVLLDATAALRLPETR